MGCLVGPYDGCADGADVGAKGRHSPKGKTATRHKKKSIAKRKREREGLVAVSIINMLK